MGWTLIWADEFEGNALDGSSWTAQTGDGTAEGIPGEPYRSLKGITRFMSCTQQLHRSMACMLI